ncbi:ABC transporter sub-family G-like protein 1 [Leptotrombidium deliense]|uniref:ABC transporter sub-family G-like protein 1 n=1 Tax=Leptotrombidium deliense TaxID=299467 RepID=A0A443SHP6_9ACAR|nr:ABC transporter sub-family G-like protein 1 [Leptotrombidium deliense]
MEAFTANESENNDEFELIWSHLNYTVHNSLTTRILKRIQGFRNVPKMRQILNDINGCIHSGELMAFMGPSGAGKSTLLECIVGRRMIGKSGDILISGETLTVDNIKVAFVAQHNQFYPHLTVRESILFAATLQIATQHKHSENEELSKSGMDLNDYCSNLTDAAIVNLGLETCSNNRLNNCSGGQLKRLAIAQELISNPRILVLDEPTSGLDSISCFQVIEVLEKLTTQAPKMAILVTMHQPSVKILNLFHKVYVVNKNGECIYEDKPEMLQITLRNAGLQCPVNYNPADFIMEVAYGEHGFEVIDYLAAQHRYLYKEEYKIAQNCKKFEVKTTKAFPFLNHCKTLFQRNLVSTLRNPLLFGLRLMSTFAVPFFLATIFGFNIGARGGCPPKFDSEFEPSQLDYIQEEIIAEIKTTFNNAGCVFFITQFVMFNVLMPTSLAFPEQMIVFKSEKSNHWYGLNSFYFSNFLVESVFQLSFLLIYWPIANYTLDESADLWRFWLSFLLLLVNSFISQTYGYIFGTICMHNIPASVFLGPALLIVPFMSLSGLFIKAKSMSVFFKVLSYLSFIRFVVEGMFITLYGFGRCSHSTNSLVEGREAFIVWMSAMLGVYNEETPSSIAMHSNGSTEQSVGVPSEKFIEEIIDSISGKFISNANDVRSLVMNEYNLDDTDLHQSFLVLFVYLIILRVFAYFVIAIKVKTNQ